jgi:oxepin-CoA hydrolase/3-oxo-5,6-dehydrosuberyl-CoA semialdehyde dehydrogenase
VTGEIVTQVSSEGLDLAAAVAHARRTGLASLGELTFPQRAAALKAAALALQERKQELYDLSARAGATPRWTWTAASARRSSTRASPARACPATR